MSRARNTLLIIIVFSTLVTLGAYMRINGNFGDGNGSSLTLTGNLAMDAGTGFTAIQINGSTGGCLMVRDTDDAGWSQGTLLDGVVTWAADDGDGICD